MILFNNFAFEGTGFVFARMHDKFKSTNRPNTVLKNHF